jgi:hypothetical protein
VLHRDLLDIINDGQAWAFVGAGASADAGVPGWTRLLEDVVSKLESELRDAVVNDSRFQKLSESGQLPKAFSRVVHFSGREAVERIVRAQTGEVKAPGAVQLEVADWPFRGYVTTNYDGLIETALRRVGQVGWTAVGNSESELLKVAGDPANVVWHVHGSLDLASERSRLVITEEDYEDIYTDDSPLLRQMRGLLANRRLVMIGFGLSDPHVMQLLRRIGRYASPARPIYAFSSIEDPEERDELLERYNVDIIPYRVSRGSHGQLRDLLRTYGGMILRRSLQFGKPARQVPSHDPETTGLLLYNELLLRHHPEPQAHVLDTLLRAWLLSRLSETSTKHSLQEITQAVAARAALMRNEAGSVEAAGQVLATVRGLVSDGVVLFDERSGAVALTEKGRALVKGQAATAERLREQFAKAISDRAAGSLSDDDVIRRVTDAAVAFVAECVEHRALGVAMAAWTPRADYRSYQLVALLQDLPKFMEQLADSAEAIALTRVVQEIFTEPTSLEAQYIGLALQAQFGVHLLGVDRDALNARIDGISRTAFVVDSNVLIDHLARSGIGYDPAHLLTRRLGELGAYVTTTDLLCLEVAEHAAWAMEQSDAGSGALKTAAVRSTMGRSGTRSNSFIEGFISEVARGDQVITGLRAYFAEILGLTRKESRPTRDNVARVLSEAGIEKRDLNEWEGYEPSLLERREEYLQAIATLRRANESYKHDRQVKAEAEALIVIEEIRAGRFSVQERELDSAFFISNTRILDEIAGGGTAITMRLESALHLVATLTPSTLEEMSLFTGALLSELAQSGLAFVDRRRLSSAFSPLIDASREDLLQELDRHRALIAERYGESADQAFREVDPLETPLVLESLYAQEAEFLAVSLAAEQSRSRQLSEKASLTASEREELDRLRASSRIRDTAGRARKRAQQSARPAKKRKKRGR